MRRGLEFSGCCDSQPFEGTLGDANQLARPHPTNGAPREWHRKMLPGWLLFESASEKMCSMPSASRTRIRMLSSLARLSPAGGFFEKRHGIRIARAFEIVHASDNDCGRHGRVRNRNHVRDFDRPDSARLAAEPPASPYKIGKCPLQFVLQAHPDCRSGRGAHRFVIHTEPGTSRSQRGNLFLLSSLFFFLGLGRRKHPVEHAVRGVPPAASKSNRERQHDRAERRWRT